MEHVFLFRKQAHELNMRQMVEEITLGCHTIESAMAKYQMRTCQTVSGWSERVRQEELARTAAMKQVDSPPPPTLVERGAQATVCVNCNIP